MKYTFIANLFLWFFLITTNALYAQNTERISTDTVVGGFEGKMLFYVQNQNSEKIKSGRFSFEGNPILEIHGANFLMKGFNFFGNYADGSKQGLWQFEKTRINIESPKLIFGIQTRLNHQLNGLQSRFTIRYKNNFFNGIATWTETPISNSRMQNRQTILQLSFEDDTLKGKFEYNNQNVSFSGQTDALGFLDGKLQLKYPDNDSEVIEHRVYSNGFLLQLIKLNAVTKDTLFFQLYPDVINQLDQLKAGDESLNFKKSDIYFGTKFNLGYPSNHPKLIEQADGNRLLDSIFSIFDSFHNIQEQHNEVKTIKKLTRRFQFVYPEEEDSIMLFLSRKCDTLKTSVLAVLARPTLIMRKEQSDSLNLYYQILSKTSEKLYLIDDLLRKVQDGYFHFRFRNTFLAKGIPELQGNDTISTTIKGKSISIPFGVQQQISGPENLLQNLEAYLSELKEISDHAAQNIKELLRLYDNQDIIDSLDLAISKLEKNLQSTYPKLALYQSLPSEKVPFAYKMYFSIEDRLLAAKKADYLKRGNSFEEAKASGQELLCLLIYLENNVETFEKIGSMEKFWNDSLFTRYQSNPFDYRKLETKILEGVNQGVVILLKQYGNQMLNAKNCKQLEQLLTQIEQLDLRTRYIVNKANTEDVQKLNRTLRRERVANRIERILEL